MSQQKKDWYRLAEKLHRYYGGKIETVPKVPLQSFDEFSIWYTPGVAEPCRRIQKALKEQNEDLSFEYTCNRLNIPVGGIMQRL